ncbi:hypothetical protein SAMN05216600_101180 [Pseudomonas cuatrocienegasensis]|uniref:Wadjet protein JetD C-terminal domain-containing protein n=1 Tax=Pseudomonas cuatrocienegasensis TaxID=543360 RepID=A0ABY1B0L7_9PSED|nr:MULTISPECIES: DUF3322 domain-containing protein [Pseudomonas]OEC36088.1 hypothetical protein A7D25_05690 [Pseudomonas sp. 21C1]SEP64085.1 hypothetical protein SAMN05216600_101180 [Pseudomonas cuatrocienegasensis]
MTSWTTPTDLRTQVQRLWDQGVLLRAQLHGEPLFPLALRLKRPDTKALAERFDEVRQWIRQLQAGAGHYQLDWQTINHRQLGRNQVPAGAHLDSLDAALAMLGKRREAERFAQLCRQTLAGFPELHDWLTRHPLRALEQAEHWSKVMAVLDWFRAHPHSGLYLRQLDIAGVDSKFIEQRRGLLGELLDRVLQAEALDAEARGVRGFSRRYGLRDKPLLVRLRILDPRLYINGLSDLSAPVEQIAQLELDLERVFVTENETNALAFPAHERALVILGQGYALERLGEIPWLHRQPLHYWGDIDTHGFAILDRLRAHLPQAKSLLMDRDTLLEHQVLWGQEPADKRCSANLGRLTNAEQMLYRELRDDHLGERLRLEQEHVRFGWLQQALDSLPV